MKAREAAFFAFVDFEKKKAELVLSSWVRSCSPCERDLALAKEIAYGCIKRWASLEHLCKKIPYKRITQSEKRLLQTALYQKLYLQKIPEHALVFESVEIAKKHFGKKKADWINALLRKVLRMGIKTPRKEEGLVVYYSYPSFFLERMHKVYPKKVEEILQSQNQTYLPCIRFLKEKKPALLKEHPKSAEILYEKKLVAARIKEKKWVKPFLKTEYLQNVTPVFLMETLADSFPPPKTGLDACSSPGGKLLCASLLWEGVFWYANDISKEKLERLRENVEKHSLKVTLLQGALEKKPLEKVDLVLLDVPCSNSGVLGKKPEARWRLSKSFIQELVKKQKEWIEKACCWVKPEGEIWYMTCSILPEENEDICDFLEKKGWRKRKKVLVLPNPKGWDGGFGCALYRTKS